MSLSVQSFLTTVFGIVLMLLTLVIGPVSAQAQSGQQEECFTQLQSSALEIPAFSRLHEQMKGLKYSDVSSSFSPYYKNISSFGIDLRSPDFDMRLYSFGRDTGYQHPPFSPFPIYTLSDKWEEPAKEYIIAEEYVRDTQTSERIFVSCALMSIESADLKGVTAERYLNDGALSSVLFTSSDKSYKAWYTSNDSFDHEGRNFVTWRRLFVYPKSTVNQFFDRYTVANAFPARTTNNLADIKRLRSKEHTEETVKLLVAPELKGYDTVFALNSYYSAIESTYPKFAEKLSLRGVLQYKTVKELLATRGVEEFSSLWNTVLNPNDITKYALLKEKGELVKENGDGVIQKNEESVFFEEQLKKIANLTLDNEARNLLDTVSARNPLGGPMPEIISPQQSFLGKYQSLITVGGLVLVVLLSGLLVWLRKRRVQGEDIVA